MIKKNLQRRITAGIALLAASLAISPSLGQAKMMRGEVIAVKENNGSFSFKNANPSKPPLAQEQFDIVVLPNARFEKIGSLKELRAGDEVVVDAEKNKESGIWEASAVRISKVRLYQEVLAPETLVK